MDNNLVQMDFVIILISCKWDINFVQMDNNLVQMRLILLISSKWGFCNNINLVQMGY